MEVIEALPRLISWAVPIIILAIIILPQAIRILREYERGVIFRLGKLLGSKGPGLIFLIPIVDRMVRMDLRVVTIDVPRQEVMTHDNVPVSVDAVLYFRVIDPQAAVVKVENFLKATSLIAQTTLRSVLGQAELDELLAHREKINQTLQEIIDRQTDPWGIKVTTVEVKDVSLPDTMKRAMAKRTSGLSMRCGPEITILPSCWIAMPVQSWRLSSVLWMVAMPCSPKLPSRMPSLRKRATPKSFP